MEATAAIKVNKVSKDFKLPHERHMTLKSTILSFFKGRRSRTVITQHALRDISLDIQPGEFFGIVGRNGSGKSTLLKILAGIYQPTRGSAQVSGKLVPFIELGVGFNPELTGHENVYLNGALLGFSDKEIDQFYQEVVDFAELHQFMDQKLKNYSSGMQVRLAFSMAIQAQADVLLIDEVLAVGDADFQRKCFEYFKKLKRERKTVIFVSHDMSAVREYCDRAALIEKGKLMALDNSARIANQYDKLFAKEVVPEDKKSRTARARWGAGIVQIKQAHLEKSSLETKDKSLTIHVSLEGYNVSQDLMTGFVIKNGMGQIINATNTWNLKQVLPELGPGKTYTVSWILPNIYEAGLHVIDLYVYGKGNEVLDYQEETLAFKVNKSRTGALTNPALQIRVHD